MNAKPCPEPCCTLCLFKMEGICKQATKMIRVGEMAAGRGGCIPGSKSGRSWKAVTGTIEKGTSRYFRMSTQSSSPFKTRMGLSIILKGNIFHLVVN